MDEFERNIKNVLSQEIDIPEHYTNAIKTAFDKKKKKANNWLKVAAVVCIGITVTGGIAFATKEYIKKTRERSFGLSKEIDNAVENGYIKNTNMDYVSSKVITIEEKQYTVRTKITDFLMDDINLSAHFDFEFVEIINEIANIANLTNIEILDLIVTDENNNIIYNNDRKSFEKFCTENNLDYKFNEFNEHYYPNGLNNFINYKNENNIVFTYNMYTSEQYPKSKQLNFYFTKIKLQEKDKDEIILEGNWQISVNVPEEMYNRQTISYKVTSCSNSDFSITTATLYEDRFEFGTVIANMKKPDDSEFIELLNQYPEGVNENTDKETRDKFERLYKEILPSIGNEYIENQNGQRFGVSSSPTKRENCNYTENGKLDLYITFAMTKYEATDKLKLTIYLKDEPVIIKLEKIV